MTKEFQLQDNVTLEIKVKESEKGCTTVSQRFLNKEGKLIIHTCTVTCTPPGKSYSWSCPDDKDCEGDCSDPNNPTGRCS